MKEVKVIKLITKQEAFEMRKMLGEENIKKSKSRHPKYYLVETNYNLNVLRKYQNSKTLDSKQC